MPRDMCASVYKGRFIFCRIKAALLSAYQTVQWNELWLSSYCYIFLLLLDHSKLRILLFHMLLLWNFCIFRHVKYYCHFKLLHLQQNAANIGAFSGVQSGIQFHCWCRRFCGKIVMLNIFFNADLYWSVDTIYLLLMILQWMLSGS